MAIFRSSRLTGTEQVWLFFHCLELLITSISFWFHFQVTEKSFNEPVRHTIFADGNFFFFLMVDLLDVIRILTGGLASEVFLIFLELTGTITFFISAMLCMYYVEHDIHLQYIDGPHEESHPFFKYTKAESLTSISISCIHLLHGFLLVDSYVSYGGLENLLAVHYKAIQPSIRATFETRFSSIKGTRSLSTEIAHSPIVLGICHQRIELFDVLQRRLEQCCKLRGREMFKAPLFHELEASFTKSSTSTSVRFTAWFFINKLWRLPELYLEFTWNEGKFI